MCTPVQNSNGILEIQSEAEELFSIPVKFIIDTADTPTLLVTEIVEEQLTDKINSSATHIIANIKGIKAGKYNIPTQNMYFSFSPMFVYRSGPSEIFAICEFSQELVVMKQKKVKVANTKIYLWVKSDELITDAVLKACQSRNVGNRDIECIFNHPSFCCEAFVKNVLQEDKLGNKRLLDFSDEPASLLIEMAKGYNFPIDPLGMIYPESNRNIFMEAAYRRKDGVLKTLINHFPETFKLIGKDVLASYLQSGGSQRICEEMFRDLEKLMGASLAWGNAWLRVAGREKLDEGVEKTLSNQEKKVLYEIAYVYENPFVFEPLDCPLPANSHSINLIWINAKPMPQSQEFLIDPGNDLVVPRTNFHKLFVIPIAKWAKGNCSASINIWYDSEMATTSAVRNSQNLFTEELEGVVHGPIHFRDIRSTEIIQSNKDILGENMPIYFRVDLVRAMLADHVLRNNETQYFVYADIDMEPLSEKEIFDKKTVDLLDVFGIVMAPGGGIMMCENGFQILNGKHTECMSLHREVIIDANVNKARKSFSAIKRNNQEVYHSYVNMRKTEQPMKKWGLPEHMPKKPVILPKSRFN